MKKVYLFAQRCPVFFVIAMITSCSGQSHSNGLESSHPAQQIISKTDAQIAGISEGIETLQPVQNIRSMLHDRNDMYWFGSDGDGLYRYDGKSLALLTDKDGLCGNQIQTIQQDKSGNIWLGTGKGICCYDGRSFRNFKDYPQTLVWDGLPNVWRKEPGNLWFSGGANGGIYRYDGNSFSNYRFPGDEPESPSSSRPYSLYDIYCIFEDRAGNLWFGTQNKGVCRFDGKNLSWFVDEGLAGAAVRTIFQDKAGNLWFGNNGYGLFRYDGKYLRNITAEKGLDNPGFLEKFQEKEGTLARVWAINEDTDGNLWIGTIDAGAWRYDGKNMTNYTTKDGLTDNGITAIYKDQKGELWFGTAGELCKFNGKYFAKVANRGR